MNTSDNQDAICPICLRRIEPDEEVIEEGEREVHLHCHLEPDGKRSAHYRSIADKSKTA